MPCFFITSLHNKIHSQALKLADSGMSDYEENDEDVVDVVENETIDWGEDHEVDQEKSLYRGKQSTICFINIYIGSPEPVAKLPPIPEESFQSTGRRIFYELQCVLQFQDDQSVMCQFQVFRWIKMPLAVSMMTA